MDEELKLFQKAIQENDEQIAKDQKETFEITDEDLAKLRGISSKKCQAASKKD
ncbi:hypothetical protein [Bdellovibrio sp. HCB209]|uniref:hypothetical protein n=1 Tax=Bdellovibrio sp. HCB209 TaxID=3394354 RepID=UPI0039B3C87D